MNATKRETSLLDATPSDAARDQRKNYNHQKSSEPIKKTLFRGSVDGKIGWTRICMIKNHTKDEVVQFDIVESRRCERNRLSKAVNHKEVNLEVPEKNRTRPRKRRNLTMVISTDTQNTPVPYAFALSLSET